MKVLTALAVAAAVPISFAQGAAAQTSPAPAGTGQDGIVVKGKKPAKDKRVCKRSTPTGSVIPVTVCRTAGDWDAETEKGLVLREQLAKDRRARQFTAESQGNRP